ncbi:MAG: ATP-binding protein [Bacteroidia bacterium]
MEVISRHISIALRQRLLDFPVVAITGPRQAGKTTLARTLMAEMGKPSVYLDLELPSDLNKLTNAELFLQEHEDKLVVIDEVQRKPELFPLLRALVDQRRVPGRFLILGSASPELLRQSSETLAGRISYLELHPFNIRELPQPDFRTHWLRGGFPPALLASSDKSAFQWLEDFSITFIERDLPQFGLNAPSQTLQNLLLMLTGFHGGILNQSTLANSLGLSVPTVKRYLEYIERAYFIRFLLPWYANIGKRLVKSPKVYFRDSGVLHYFAGISDLSHLLGNKIAGASWEGYVIQQVLANLPSRVLPFFYRTKDGSELDMVLVKGNQPWISLEIKFTDTPSLSKGNHIAFADVGAPLNLIITPTGGDYPLADNIRVCDLASMWKYIHHS